MEKFFMPFVIMIFVVSTVIIAVALEFNVSRNSDKDICVESRSCAIRYINNLEKEQE